jgi:hypothetical protein
MCDRPVSASSHSTLSSPAAPYTIPQWILSDFSPFAVATARLASLPPTVPHNAAALMHRALPFHCIPSHFARRSQRVTATALLSTRTMIPGKASFKTASLTAGETPLPRNARALQPLLCFARLSLRRGCFAQLLSQFQSLHRISIRYKDGGIGW